MREEKGLSKNISDFETLPTGNPLMMLYTFMGSVNDIPSFAKNWTNVAETSGELSVKTDDGNVTLIGYDESKTIKSKRSHLESYFIFLVCRIADSDVACKPTPQISFKIRDLIRVGMFADYHNAKRAVDDYNEFLTTLTIRTRDGSRARFFETLNRTRGIVTVAPGSCVPWSEMLSETAFFPRKLYGAMPMSTLFATVILKYAREGIDEIGLPDIARNISVNPSTPYRAIKYIERCIDELNSSNFCVKISTRKPNSFRMGFLSLEGNIAKGKRGCVYKLLDGSDRILYIGKSYDVHKRIEQHKRMGHLPGACYEATETVEWCVLPTLADAGIVERYLIGTYLPKYNTQYANEGIPSVAVDISGIEWSREPF